jgi:hypothetical protein
MVMMGREVYDVFVCVSKKKCQVDGMVEPEARKHDDLEQYDPNRPPIYPAHLRAIPEHHQQRCMNMYSHNDMACPRTI